MAYLNRLTVIGNLTKDMEVRHTQNGTAVGSFGIAVNTPVGKDKETGEVKTETLFLDVVTFGKRAEALAEYMTKGRLVYLEGRLRYRTWEDNDGNRRSKHELLLEKVQFLGTATSDAAQPDDIGMDDDVPF